LIVSSGGVANGARIQSGGTLYFDGGSATGSVFGAGGAAVVDSGGSVSGLTIGNGVTLTVKSGGSVGNSTIGSGGTLVFGGGATSGTTLKYGAAETVAHGVKVSDLTVGNGVTLRVLSGGTAGNTTLNGGGMEIVAAGGFATGTVTFAKNATLSVGGAKNQTLKVSGFAATDTLDLADYAFKGANFTFVENKAKTQGVLTVTDGGLTAKVTLLGQYVATGFHLASDGATGTAITYSTSAHSAHGDLAPHPA
jgi:autotransporter passenger strand-loop-strand repeat protein